MTSVDQILIRRLAQQELDRRQKILVQKEDAERDLVSFVRMTWSIIEPVTVLAEGWVLDTMADSLMAACDGHIKHLILNVPPGSMKSLLLNVFYPAWLWGPCRMPHLRFLSISYTASLTERDNGRFRRLITHPLYKKCWGDVFNCDTESVEVVENDKTGWKRAISVTSGVTGFRGDYILCDDLNNPHTVESETVRDMTNMWLQEIMPDRLNNLRDGVIINVQQRTHMEDATETLAKMWGGDCCWVCIPQEFEPLRIGHAIFRREEDGSVLESWTDPRSLDENGNQLEGLYNDDKGNLKVRMGSPMAVAEGDLAWPERFDPEAVAKLKAGTTAYAWSARQQQSPTVRGGEIIRRDWWQLWNEKSFPDMGTVVASLDTAVEENNSADYNALTVWGAFPGLSGEPKLMLRHAWRARLPLAQLVARVAEICREHKVDYLVIEHKTRGRDVHDEIVRLYQNASWQTILWKVQGDKSARLNAVSHLFSGDVRKDPVSGIDIWSNGMIYAPDTVWADEVITEICQFPRGAHDDYTDSVTQALSFMRKNGVVLRKVEYDDQETDRKKFRRTQSVPYAI